MPKKVSLKDNKSNRYSKGSKELACAFESGLSRERINFVPDELNEQQGKIYLNLVEKLSTLNVCDLDIELLTQISILMDYMFIFKREVDVNPTVYDNKKGYSIANPLVIQVANLSKQISTMLSNCGMSPSSRVSLISTLAEQQSQANKQNEEEKENQRKKDVMSMALAMLED